MIITEANIIDKNKKIKNTKKCQKVKTSITKAVSNNTYDGGQTMGEELGMYR